MRTPNRHIKYRRSVYRKNNIKIIIITSLVAIIVTVLLFVIIGNIIGNKVEENISKRNEKNTQSEQTEHTLIKSVKSYPVMLSDENSKLSSRLSNITKNGYTDVSFKLNSSEGVLLYASPVAQSLGRQSSGVNLWSLEEAIQLCKENGLYSTGIIHLSDFYTDDDLARTVSLGYYSAQIAEALRSGIDDILIFAKDIPIEQYYELSGLAKEIHRLCPEGKIGLSLPSSVFSNQEFSETVDAVWNSFDYLAVDLSVVPDDTTVIDYVNDNLGSMLYYLLRYNIRVLVPYSDDLSVISVITDTVTSNGTQNIQFIQ